MKKKLALLLAAAMVVSSVPMTAFAATTNRVSKIATGNDDTTLTSSNAPILRMGEKDMENASGAQLTFELDLANAEWNYSDVVTKNADGTNNYDAMFENLIDTKVTDLSAKSIIVEGTVTKAAEADGIGVYMLTDLTDNGDATVTIDPMQSILSSGTYKFATVADGDATVTIEKKTDVSENKTTLKNVVIKETSPMALDDEGTIKLKLSNDWAFTDINVTVYPSNLKSCFNVVSPTGTDEDYELDYDFKDASGNDLRPTDTPVIITITPEVKYDDDEVQPGEICEMTVSGGGITKTTLEVATAVTYGVTWEAEDKTLPVFYSGEMDEDKDSLEVTMEEAVETSWITNRKTKIVFPEGVRVLGVDVSNTSNVNEGTFDINEDANQLTFEGWTVKDDTDTAEIHFKFQLSIAPDFTGDITATLTGAGVGEEISAVIGTAVAPVTVEAASTDAIIDYRHTSIGDITITEAEAGLLEKGDKFALEIENLGFDEDPTVEVVSGDLKLKDVKVEDNSNGVGNKLIMTIDSESAKEPAVIKITNCELYMTRDIPAGEYALKLTAVNPITPSTDKDGNRNLKWDASTSDSAFINLDDNKDAIFQNSIASGVSEDNTPYFDKRSVTVVDKYINVVTSGRDQGDNTFTTQLKVTIGATEMYANDKAIALDVPAYISNGYTMLPVRAVTEALSDSAIVRWDDPSHTVTITFGDRVINMTVGSNVMVINGVEVPMQAQCEITDSRAFIPLRDMGYALGLNDSKINWDDATKTATLN